MVFDLLPAVFASVAAALDVRSRRIPNWLTLAAFCTGVLVHVVRSGSAGLAIALGGAAVGLCLLLPFYFIRALGAGDVKLLAGLGALLGPQAVVSVFLYGAVIGGVISVIILAQKHQLGRSMHDIMTRPTHMRLGGATAPYGVAIASGVYLSMLLPNVLA